MQRALLVLLLMVGLVVGGIQVMAAASDQFVVLDPYDPRGINDHGDIVGVYADATGIHGFFLSHSTVTNIDSPASCPFPTPGGPQIIAWGLNNRGQVVGGYSVCGTTATTHGFLWEDGVLTTIDAPGGGLSLTSINDSRDMVGFVESGGIQSGVLLSHGTFTALVNPDSQDVPAPFGINNRGDIVGTLGGDGFLLSKGQWTLFRVPESGFTEARGINDQGDIAGFWLDAEGTTHGYVLSQGELTELHVPAGTITLVSGINNRGEVVGTYQDETGTPHGFLLQVR